MPHIYNLAVGDILRTFSTHEAFAEEALAVNATYDAKDLEDPILAIRGLVAAVCLLEARLVTL